MRSNRKSQLTATSLAHSFSWSSGSAHWTFSLNVTFTKTVGFKLSWRLSRRKQWQVAGENMGVECVCLCVCVERWVCVRGVYVTAGMWRRSELNYCVPSAGDWVGVCSAKCVCRHSEVSTWTCSRGRAFVGMLWTHACVCLPVCVCVHALSGLPPLWSSLGRMWPRHTGGWMESSVWRVRWRHVASPLLKRNNRCH